MVDAAEELCEACPVSLRVQLVVILPANARAIELILIRPDAAYELLMRYLASCHSTYNWCQRFKTR